jgi:hypothetical protein
MRNNASRSCSPEPAGRNGRMRPFGCCAAYLRDFPLIASKPLQTIRKFEAGVPVVLQEYIATCDNPTKAIPTEDSNVQKDLRAVTVEG